MDKSGTSRCVARNGLDKDRMITAYRNHVQPIGMGVDPKRVMAELLGKVTGLLKEWVVPCIFSQRAPFLWWSRNCGRTNSCRTGLAFADKYFETNAVTLTYFGDGAARQVLYRSL
jgi:pyruvate dehydrogenase E1 component alpha subunit